MVGCVMPKCGYNSSNNNKEKRSCHKIPEDPERRALFISQINTVTGEQKRIRKGTKTITTENGVIVQDPSRVNARICSSHFKSEWLIEKVSRYGKITKELHKDAYPIYKNQQEKDEAEKTLYNKPTPTQQAELTTTSSAPSVTNKSEAPSLKIVILPNSDGTYSVRTGNKMVKMALPTSFASQSTSEVPGYYYNTTSFAENVFPALKNQGTFNASSGTSTFAVPEFDNTPSFSQSTSKVPGYYNATSSAENTFPALKNQGTFNASGSTSTFSVQECDNTTSFAQSTSKVPSYYNATSFAENAFTELKNQGTFNASSGTSTFAVQEFDNTTSFAESTSKVPSYYNATSFVEDKSTFCTPKRQDTADASGGKIAFVVPENTISFVENGCTFGTPKCQDTADASGGKSAFVVPENTISYTTSFVENGSTLEMWRNEVYNAGNKSTCGETPEHTFYNGTAMENKSIFEDLGFPCEDLDSLSDEVHFMQSSHTQVSIQPTELPVVDQQALDAVFVRPEEAGVNNLRPEENSVDALVGNLLNNYIANVRDGDSSESLVDYLATL